MNPYPTHHVVTDEDDILRACIHPEDYFLSGEYADVYSRVDTDGVPTHDISGEPLSPSAITQARKEHELQKAKYLTWELIQTDRDDSPCTVCGRCSTPCRCHLCEGFTAVCVECMKKYEGCASCQGTRALVHNCGGYSKPEIGIYRTDTRMKEED